MIRRDYTARGQLERVWDSSGQQPVRYYYHKDGKVDRQDHSNGTTTAFGYDGRGMISSVHHKRTANGSNLSYRDYWRDNRDRITAWKKSSDSIVNPMENGRGDRYAYDEAGQLTTARYQAQNPQGNATSPERGDDFVYDALGNRKGANNWVASRGQMLNFTIKENGLNQYSGWWPYSAIRHDEDIGMPWGRPQHANGTIMEEGWITGGFNALNQPIQIFGKAYMGTTNWMWFGFDPLGRCVKRWVTYPGGPDTGATYYYYDGWNLLQEGASPASVQRLYIHGARVDEIVKSFNYTSTTSQSAWHHYDARGHCTMLTGPNGEILEQYDYDAFGFPYFYDGQGNSLTFYDTPSNSVRGRSPYGNRFLFTGREWLTDLKLYDYRNRIYHPELGRFLQPDPKHFTAGDYNFYRYCGNDPVNKSDPMGLEFFPYNGPPIPVDQLYGGAGMGQSRVEPTVVVVPDGDGFKLRLDVRITGILIADRVKFHGKMEKRSDEQKRVTFEEHEKGEHGKDWRGFHDQKQKEVPGTRYNDRDAAEKAAKPLTEKFKSDGSKANREFEKHQPDERWKNIRDRELPR